MTHWKRPWCWERLKAGGEDDDMVEMTGWDEDEMVGWHHLLKGLESEQVLGVDDGQGSLACCSPRCSESRSLHLGSNGSWPTGFMWPSRNRSIWNYKTMFHQSLDLNKSHPSLGLYSFYKGGRLNLLPVSMTIIKHVQKTYYQEIGKHIMKKSIENTWLNEKMLCLFICS